MAAFCVSKLNVNPVGEVQETQREAQFNSEIKGHANGVNHIKKIYKGDKKRSDADIHMKKNAEAATGGVL